MTLSSDSTILPVGKNLEKSDHQESIPGDVQGYLRQPCVRAKQTNKNLKNVSALVKQRLLQKLLHIHKIKDSVMRKNEWMIAKCLITDNFEWKKQITGDEQLDSTYIMSKTGFWSKEKMSLPKNTNEKGFSEVNFKVSVGH